MKRSGSQPYISCATCHRNGWRGQNGPLRFANQAYEAEMCILFGASIGDVGLLEQLGPPPDFAKVR
ncbi:MAG TPA: hypothetical protein VMF89_10905 [Polyangiales bacterium]|nr:hypothetical protein [Polyangiales bacterium]